MSDADLSTTKNACRPSIRAWISLTVAYGWQGVAERGIDAQVAWFYAFFLRAWGPAIRSIDGRRCMEVMVAHVRSVGEMKARAGRCRRGSRAAIAELRSGHAPSGIAAGALAPRAAVRATEHGFVSFIIRSLGGN